MDLKQYYEGFKEKYGSFCDSLSERGVPSPRVLVPVACLLLIVAIVFLAFPALGLQEREVTLTISDSQGYPVSGAYVTLYDAEEETGTVATDSNGRASFTAKSNELRVSVQASGFQSIEQKRVYEDASTISLTSLTPASRTVVIKVKDALGNDLQGAQVILSFDDGTARSGVTDAFGESSLSVQEPVADHATLKASKAGYLEAMESVYSSQMSGVLIIELKAAEAETEEGSAIVIVKDYYGSPLGGLTVTLVDYYNEQGFRSGYTDNEGTFVAEGLEVGRKYRVAVTDPRGDYVSYSSKEHYSIEKQSSPVIVQLESSEGASDAIDLTVLNEDLNPVQGATVRVYEQLTARFLAQAQSNAFGKAEVKVAKGKAFYVTVHKDGYLPARLESMQAGDKESITLEREKTGNYIDVAIHCESALTGEPVPNAAVELFTFNGFPLGTPARQAGADGIAWVRVPSRINGEQYDFYAIATKDFWVGQTDAAVASEGLELYAMLQPTPGSVEVTMTDLLTEEAVDGASVELWAGGAFIASCDLQPCEFQVAPEQEFYFKAEAPGYLDAETATQIVSPGESIEKEIQLYPLSLSSTAAIQLQGVYDSNGDLVQELSNAEDYEARFLVTIPSSGVEDAKAFFKLGVKPTSGEEELVFDSFDCPGSPGFEEGAYYDESCSSTSFESESGGAKWYSIQLPDGFVGTKEISLTIHAKPEAKAGSETLLQYRLNGYKAGVPFLSPVDEAALQELLGNASSNALCFAETHEKKLKVSSDPLVCAQGACYRLYFESIDGTRRGRFNFKAEAGEEFYLSYEVLSLDSPVSSIAINAPDVIELESWLDDYASLEEYQHSAIAGVGERTGGKARLLALRASNYAQLEFTIMFEDASEEPVTVPLFLEIEGSNEFEVLTSPDSLLAGLEESVTVTVLDQFARPVEDASLTFFDCDGEPLNGQELDVLGDGSRNYGENGKYKARLEAATIGSIGLSVTRAGFKDYEDCAIEVNAANFIIVEPETLQMSGSSVEPGTLARQVSLISLLPIDSSVTTSVECYSSGSLTQGEQAVYVAPQAFTLRDDAIVQVFPIEGVTAKADCYVTFNARVNADNYATKTVLVSVDLQGPGTPLCPSPYSCLTQGEAEARECSLVESYACASTSFGLPEQSCFACETGPSTLPSSMSFTLSNTKPVETQNYLISLSASPEECRIDGFAYYSSQQAATQYQQANQYPQSNPYQQPSQYPQQSSYYNYQPNAYTPQQSPWGNTQQYSLGGQYSYLNGMNSYGASAQTPYAGASYGSQYGLQGGFGVPNNCPPGLNPQSMYGSYASNQLTNPWQQSYATGYSANCQYPLICQNPQYCSHTQSSMTYGASYDYACQYPAICNNPSNCPQMTGVQPAPSYPSDTQPPVRVRIDACTPNELQVTAEYTGADYQYNSGLGGVQEGVLFLKLGPGATRSIPIIVTVESAPTLPQQSSQYSSSQYQAYPMTPMIPPECFYGMQSWGTGDYEGLDENGLPTEITVYVNPVNGYGHYERTLPINRITSCRWEDKPEGAKDLECGSTFKVTIEQDEFDGEEGTIKAYVAGATEPVEIPVYIEEDDLVPQVIQLLTTETTGDEAVYELDCEECTCKEHLGSGMDAKCKDNELTASVDADHKTTKYEYYVEITDKENYAIHRVPFFVAYTDYFDDAPEENEGTEDWERGAKFVVVASWEVSFEGFGVMPDANGLAEGDDIEFDEDDLSASFKVTDKNGVYSFYPEGDDYQIREEPIFVMVVNGEGESEFYYDSTKDTYSSTPPEPTPTPEPSIESEESTIGEVCSLVNHKDDAKLFSGTCSDSLIQGVECIAESVFNSWVEGRECAEGEYCCAEVIASVAPEEQSFASVNEIVQLMHYSADSVEAGVYALADGTHAFVFKALKGDQQLEFTDSLSRKFSIHWNEEFDMNFMSPTFSAYLKTSGRQVEKLDCFHGISASTLGLFYDIEDFAPKVSCNDCDYDSLNTDFATRVWFLDINNDRRWFVVTVADGECDDTNQGQNNII